MRRRLRAQMGGAIRCSVLLGLISGGLPAQEPMVFLENPETLIKVRQLLKKDGGRVDRSSFRESRDGYLDRK